MLCCVESIKLMKIDKYAVQVQGVHQPSSFLNLLREGPQLPVMTSQIIHKIKVRKITLINVNTYPVSKISKYLNLILFDKHNLSLSYKISNSLGVHTLLFKRPIWRPWTFLLEKVPVQNHLRIKHITHTNTSWNPDYVTTSGS